MEVVIGKRLIKGPKVMGFTVKRLCTLSELNESDA